MPFIFLANNHGDKNLKKKNAKKEFHVNEKQYIFLVARFIHHFLELHRKHFNKCVQWSSEV